MVKKKKREREGYEERTDSDRRTGGDGRKNQVLIDFPDRRGSGDRRKQERREGEDRRRESGAGESADAEKPARPRTYRDSKGNPDDKPRRGTYRDG